MKIKIHLITKQIVVTFIDSNKNFEDLQKMIGRVLVYETIDIITKSSISINMKYVVCVECLDRVDFKQIGDIKI